MAIDPAVFEGKQSLIIKCTDGAIISHYLVTQQYDEVSLGMSLLVYAQALVAAHEPDKTYEDHALESTFNLEQFIYDGGIFADVDVVDGEVLYPEV